MKNWLNVYIRQANRERIKIFSGGFSSVSWWGFFHWLFPRNLPIDRTVRFKSLHGDAVKNIWTSFCQSGSLKPNPAKGQPRILDETDLDLAQVLKQIAPSMAYKDLKEYIERYSAKSPSISAIGLAVREHIWAWDFPFTNLFILFLLKPIDRSVWANIFIAVSTRLEYISCANVLFELLIIEHKFASSFSVFFSFDRMSCKSDFKSLSCFLSCPCCVMSPQNLAEVHISFGQLSRVWPARKLLLEHTGRINWNPRERLLKRGMCGSFQQTLVGGERVTRP